jgi:hypothetical protein
MSLIGTLSEIKLADVLRLFASSKKSGLITASGPGGRQTLIRFQKGLVVHASAGRLQGDDAVMDLFGWPEGQLTFVREGGVFHRMQELIPTDRVSFQLAQPASEGALCTFGPPQWKVLCRVDGVRDVRDLVEGSDLPRNDVLRLLFDLTEAGFLEKVDSQKTLRAQVQGRFGKGEAAEVDERLRQDWGRLTRFTRGVLTIEVRTFARRGSVLPVAFRAGLGRDVHLPRAVFAEIGLREGEDVFVRPVA